MNNTKPGAMRMLLPNLLTLMVSLCGLAAMGLAYYHHTRMIAVAFFLAGLFDTVDGFVARRLNAQSKFGNIYDSMSDFLAFGIAPAFSLIFLDLVHPAVALFYVLAIQFRLTRYSAAPDDGTPKQFFQGLSSPDAVYVGVLLSLAPYSSFNWGFSTAGLLAVYPGKLWPRKYTLVKVLIGAAAMIGFIHQGAS